MGNRHTKKAIPPEIAAKASFTIGERFNTPDGIVEVVGANPDFIYMRNGNRVLFRLVRVGGGPKKKRSAVPVSSLIDSEHSSSKWSRQRNSGEKRISVDGSPPDKFMTENIGID